MRSVLYEGSRDFPQKDIRRETKDILPQNIWTKTLRQITVIKNEIPALVVWSKLDSSRFVLCVSLFFPAQSNGITSVQSPLTRMGVRLLEREIEVLYPYVNVSYKIHIRLDIFYWRWPPLRVNFCFSVNTGVWCLVISVLVSLRDKSVCSLTLTLKHVPRRVVSNSTIVKGPSRTIV